MGLTGQIVLPNNGLTAPEGYVCLAMGEVRFHCNSKTGAAYRGANGETLTAAELAVLANEGVGKYRITVVCPVFVSQSRREACDRASAMLYMHQESWNTNDTDVWATAYGKLKTVFPNTTDC